MNIDLEQELSTPSDIANKGREIINKTPQINYRLKNIQVILLGKTTTIIKDNCHSAPQSSKQKILRIKLLLKWLLKGKGTIALSIGNDNV